MKKLKTKNSSLQQGFTTMDLIISIGILVVIFSFVLANFRGGEEDNLKLAVQKTITDARELQISALAGKLYKGSYPIGGYGLYGGDYGCDVKDPNTFCFYRIFADENGNGFCDDCGCEGCGEIIREEVIIGENTIIDSTWITNKETSEAFPPGWENDWPYIPGWTEYNGNSITVVFNRNEMTFYLYEEKQEDLTYFVFILENIKSGNKAYFFASPKTSLISGGLLN